MDAPIAPTRAAPTRSSLADRYRVLLDIGRTLTGTLGLDELYRAIYRETREVLEAGGFYIAVHDPARDLATLVFYVDRGEERRTEVTYRGSDSEVIRTGKAVLVRDRLEDGSVLTVGDEASEPTRSAISAPLRYKGRVLGAMSVQSYRPDAYGEADLELLEGIADVAAVAMENAIHVTELRRRRREAERVEEIGRALAASLDHREVLAKVVEAALELVEADVSTVWLVEGETVRVAASRGPLSLPVDFRFPAGDEEIVRRLVRERQPVVIPDMGGSRLVPDDVRPHLRTGSGLLVPLAAGGDEGVVTGALSAGTREPRTFTDDEIHILQRLASQASVALENARLHQGLQALSLTDPLTQLPNRRQLEIHLDREVAAARRGRLLVLAVLDLDDFKEYNDTLGHAKGDEILCSFARILEEENRAMNLVARYGGDEFVAVLSESTLEGGRVWEDRVRTSMASDPVLSEHGVTASCGMAAFDAESMKGGTDLFEAADRDLYRSKADRTRG